MSETCVHGIDYRGDCKECNVLTQELLRKEPAATDEELLAIADEAGQQWHKANPFRSDMSQEEFSERLSRPCDKAMLRAIYDFARKHK